MSKLLFISDRGFRDHQNPHEHPESANRLITLENSLVEIDLEPRLIIMGSREATDAQLLAVHQSNYVEELAGQAALAESRGIWIQPNSDTDTWVSPATYRTARLAAGAGVLGVEQVLRCNFENAFIAARPPGHHALSDRSLGFCFFNNVAIAARFAQQQFGLKRVLILDWDVHHGNGTQDLFYNDPSVLFISMHQYPLFPANSGWYTDDGTGAGRGFNLNIPLPAGTGDFGYLAAWDLLVLPIVRQFRPELILVSAGYDAHTGDPLGRQQVSTAGFFLMSSRLLELAKEVGAKIVSFLEGGYNPQTMAEGAASTIAVLSSTNLEQVFNSIWPFGPEYGGEVRPSSNDQDPYLVNEWIQNARDHFTQFWRT